MQTNLEVDQRNYIKKKNPVNKNKNQAWEPMQRGLMATKRLELLIKHRYKSC
jgi:hypothetical protein